MSNTCPETGVQGERGAPISRTRTSTPVTHEVLERLTRDSRRVDGWLEAAFPPEAPVIHALLEASRYPLFAGGKRFRPALVLAAAEACGGRVEDAIPAACAIELIHTYSLVHDDLPAMDDDDLRRGKATCHTVYGEGMAILAGDALLTLAFELLASGLPGTAHASHRPDPAVAVRLVAEFARGAGILGMVGGQALDLISEGARETSDDLLLAIHNMKTGALIRSSARAGAISARAPESEIEILSRFGDEIGLLFQIADDLLDTTGTSEELGKTAGKDASQAKVTFVSVFGVDGAARERDAALARTLAVVDPLGDRAGYLRDLARFVANRSR